jgi:hypothetical protein
MHNADTAHRRVARHTLVVGDPFLLRPVRLADRLLARALGASLDQQLAAGRSPESTRLLAARAQAIVSLPRRTSLARDWDHLLRLARRAPARRTPAVPLNAAAILAAEPMIRELVERLTAPLPVTAQGVAVATIPLTDATSPVYGRQTPNALASLLEDAITQLDPARPLMEPASQRAPGGERGSTSR